MRPVLYEVASACRSATVRLEDRPPLRSCPPARVFKSTNCSQLINPALSAPRPYWTPTLSNGRRAYPVAGSVPYTFTMLSWYVQRAPCGFVTGSNTSDGGPNSTGAQLLARRFGYRVPLLVQ